jgi:hypothetical protein
MSFALLSEGARARTVAVEARLLSDSELAALPPAPYRPADLVARRAAARRAEPVTVSPGLPYRVWPFLIVAGIAGSYVAAAVVLR